MKKSILGILLILTIFVVLLSSTVLAQELFKPLTDLLTSVITMVADTLNFIVGGAGLTDVAFSKLMLFVLLVAVLFAPAKMVAKGNTTIAIIIAFIVSILGVRYLVTQEIIEAVLLPYGALAVAVSSLVPFVLFGAFIENIDLGWVRKIGWIALFSAFIGLYVIRAKAIGSAVSIYGIFAFLTLIVFLFDGTIHRWRLKQRAVRGEKSAIDLEINALRGDLVRLTASMRTATTDERTKIEEEIKAINESIKRLTKVRPES